MRILDTNGDLIPIDECCHFRIQKITSTMQSMNQQKNATDEVPPHVPLMKNLAIADYEAASDVRQHDGF